MHASLAQDTAACQRTVSRFRSKLRHSAVKRLHFVLRSTSERRSCHKSSLSLYCMSQKKSTPDTRRVLTRQQAIAVYDRAGKAIKDSSSIYGGPATRAMLQAADLTSAAAVFEFGCGSGGLADLLLSSALPSTCQYHAVDQSPVQVQLTKSRLAKHGSRAQVHHSFDGPQQAAEGLTDGSCDLFVSTYVFDILSEDDIVHALHLAHRLLKPGGQLCLVGLTYGDSLISKIASWVWDCIFAVRPQLVGGCRPQNLLPYLGPEWHQTSTQIVPGSVIRSQVIVTHKAAD